ncbi:hypothetical protein FS749_001914 [Ceratobasidium sp. UAMH 11750]|nr:hypothetical protein FS749_001914 [Ceratobasidium sp. UAMH 11750]
MPRLMLLGTNTWGSRGGPSDGLPTFRPKEESEVKPRLSEPRIPEPTQDPRVEPHNLGLRVQSKPTTTKSEPDTKPEPKAKIEPTPEPPRRPKRKFDCVEIPPLRPTWRRAWEASLAEERELRERERRDARRIGLPTPEPSSRPATPEVDLGPAPRKHVVISGVRLPVSPMLDTMFYWIHERHQLFMRRFQGLPPPWTDDVILQRHRFTNVSRTYDRATQFLIRRIINVGDQDHEELFFRVVLFRLFNRISTYEYLEEHCGPLTIANFRIKEWTRALLKLQGSKTALYTAAYQINWPNFGAETANKPSHQKHFILIKHMLQDKLPSKIRGCKTLKRAFEIIREYPSFGNFTSYQLALDLNMLPEINYNQDAWAPVGPGSSNGLLKMFGSGVKGIETEAMLYLLSIQDEQWRRLNVDMDTPIHGPGLCPPKIGLPEIEHALCEVDKYSRERHPEIRLSGAKVPKSIKHAFDADRALQPVTRDLPLKWQNLPNDI